ncbi:hypothetical protein A9264_11085 [Vibrio sp. UCD-FRSSP16_10]|uniref:TolC family outer membrane protein n=1 Tax=unclassified Vibrio TaxID=2614977 RepID=UPI000801ED71|nr:MULTISPECIES: TolC family outer membrane protein [unclassified Vibrio]OBT16805.1 hypothetical protein A9260_11305 [Vibrio sp. UCD-FRSSP16_30]OBT21432.1 hypothetical protein A9264_11085 [Vibrio sp. UCD-FRSSP16_10]
MKKPLAILIGLFFLSTSSITQATNLSEVYNQAKQKDIKLQTTKAQRDAAFSNVDAQRSPLLPQINLVGKAEALVQDHQGGEYTNGNHPVQDYEEGYTTSARLVLEQELYQRSSWVNLAIAEKQARQADAVYAASQQDLIYRTTDAYFAVLRAQDKLESVRQEKQAVANQLDQVKKRHRAGLSANADIHDAEAQYDGVVAEEVIAENSLINSYEKLRQITDEKYQDIDTLNLKRFSAARSTASEEELVQKAHKQNLELLAARIEKDVAKDNIAANQSKHLPSLNLNASYGNEDYKNAWGRSSIDHSHGNELNAGLTLTVPIYSGGKTTAKSEQAEADFVASSKKLEGEYRTVDSEIRAYHNNVNAAYGTLKAYEHYIESAHAALKATLAGFKVGTRTIVDVLNSNRRVFEAERNLANARYDYILSGLHVKLVTGSLTEQDILDINQGLTKPQHTVGNKQS